ncbi:helix-turn-helix domain-containing protein [Streptomyces diastatochromogenes]|nr:helix-turn-helix domain-containing protein [Streptomyces diastatochromogenes]
MTTSPSGAPERSVVDRTLSILGAFDRDNRTLTLTDISRRSGLPVATVHRIVNKLTGWGALERCSDGLYSIGLRLWETAVLAPRSSSLAEAAQPYLVELHRQTSLGATIAIRDGAESVCLSIMSNQTDLAELYGHPGGRLPLHASSVGLVLLAHAGASVRSAICAGPLPAYTPATITDGTALGRTLVRIRREGTRWSATRSPRDGAGSPSRCATAAEPSSPPWGGGARRPRPAGPAAAARPRRGRGHRPERPVVRLAGCGGRHMIFMDIRDNSGRPGRGGRAHIEIRGGSGAPRH